MYCSARSFHLCLSTFWNIFCSRKTVSYSVSIDCCFLQYYPFLSFWLCLLTLQNIFWSRKPKNRCSIGWGSFYSYVYTSRESMYTFRESEYIFWNFESTKTKVSEKIKSFQLWIFGEELCIICGWGSFSSCTYTLRKNISLCLSAPLCILWGLFRVQNKMAYHVKNMVWSKFGKLHISLAPFLLLMLQFLMKEHQ